MTLRGPVTPPLFNWESIPQTDFLFTTVDATELEDLDFYPQEVQTDLHARLYRFLSGDGLICVPFWVGAQHNFTTIAGATLDLYGAPSQKAEHFSIKINTSQSE